MTAAQRTHAALRSDILTGLLPPGEQLIQEDIADRYGVSRVPVREALQLLTSEGLVSHVPNRGYFVTELDVTDLLEVYRLRQLLETEAIGKAIPALGDTDLARLQQLAAKVEQADSLAELTNANREFHFALFEAAGMPRLVRLLRQLWDASDVYRTLYFQQSGNRERVHHEHAAMLEAIAAADTDEAIRLHDEHRDHSVAWVRAQLLRTRRIA